MRCQIGKGSICHNFCRSQIAEALGRHLAGDVMGCYSAGTAIKTQMNQDAVRLMKQYYSINMETTQYGKLLSSIPPVDIVVTIGCNVQYPFLPCRYCEDWGGDDSTGKSDLKLLAVMEKMASNISVLKNDFTGRSVVKIVNTLIL